MRTIAILAVVAGAIALSGCISASPYCGGLSIKQLIDIDGNCNYGPPASPARPAPPAPPAPSPTE